jgi:ankyrin repeat protein
MIMRVRAQTAPSPPEVFHLTGWRRGHRRPSQFLFDTRSAIIAAMADETKMVTIPGDTPTAVELQIAVHSGEVDLVGRLLAENPELAAANFEARGGTGTALHFVTDWPGYFPNGPDIVHLLIDAGADPNALTTGGGTLTPGPGSETPLHYAASTDDVDVAAALIDRGADLETPDGSIGTPLDNAVGYACWHVARLLVTRGARVEKLWHAGALGMLDRLDELLVPEIDPELISQGFWHACGAGQRRAAERLLHAGADLNWEPDYAEGTALDSAEGLGTRQENVIEWLRSLGASSAPATE